MLRQLIDNIIQCEQSLDNIRNQLSQDTLFSIKPIMCRLDQCNHGFIDTEDLISFCSDNDIQCTHKEAYYALKYLDQNKDGKVTFDDLAKQLLPKTNRDARLLTALRDPYVMDKKMYLPEQIESGLSIFFGELLLHIREQQTLKQQLLKDFNIYKLFYDISKNEEFIQIEAFAEYFQIKLIDAQLFFQAAQQQSDTQLGCIELMDILLNSDSTSIDEQDIQVQNSPLKVNPFQNQEYKIFQNMASPRFTTEKQPKYNQDTVETVKESHDSSKFVDDIAQQLEKHHPNSMIVNNFEQVDDQDVQKLFNYILKAIHQLKILDDSKRPLVMRSDFNPMTLFSLFDSRGQGVINIDNLIKGLKLFNIKRSQQDLQQLLNQYGDGTYIKYSYFIKMISSIQPEFQLQQQQSFQKISTPKQAFNPTTIDYIKSLFELLVDTEIKFLKLKIELGLQAEIIYQILDYDEKGFIEEFDIKKFLNQQKTYPTSYELKLLTTRINNNIQADQINKDAVIEYFSL